MFVGYIICRVYVKCTTTSAMNNVHHYKDDNREQRPSIRDVVMALNDRHRFTPRS